MTLTLTHSESAATAPDPQRPRYGVAMLLVAAVVGVLVGLALGLVMRPDTPGDTSPEAGFARDMALHHGQAVEMGMIAAAQATLPEVRALGEDIALTQQGQIGMMQQWLRDWDLLPTGSEPLMAWMGERHAVTEGQRMPGMASPEEMATLRAAEGLEVDRLFVELMITHHVGGIHMVDAVLAASDHPEVEFLADAMKVGQEKELVVLRDLRDRIAAQQS